MYKNREYNHECMPCIVCGSDDLYMDYFDDKYQVVCDTCNTSTSISYRSPVRAVMQWNMLIDTKTTINADVWEQRTAFQKLYK